MAVEAVISELRLSGDLISLLSGKIQGNFADLAAKTGRGLSFSDYKSAGYAKIPYAPEQGILWS